MRGPGRDASHAAKRTRVGSISGWRCSRTRRPSETAGRARAAAQKDSKVFSRQVGDARVVGVGAESAEDAAEDARGAGRRRAPPPETRDEKAGRRSARGGGLGARGAAGRCARAREGVEESAGEGASASARMAIHMLRPTLGRAAAIIGQSAQVGASCTLFSGVADFGRSALTRSGRQFPARADI